MNLCSSTWVFVRCLELVARYGYRCSAGGARAAEEEEEEEEEDL